jgi:predicted metal-dependent peptidase
MAAKDSLHELTSKLPKSNLSQAEVEKRLIGARVQMLMQQPFFGTLATRLQLVDATKWCPTAATDGRYFYYNRDFVSALSRQELVFLMGHEVLHCVYDHFDAKRRDGRHPVLWNIANDYVINDDLVLAKCGELIKLVKICWDTKYRGQSSEEIYDKLFKDMQKQGKLKGKHAKGFNKGPQGQPGQGQPGQGQPSQGGGQGQGGFGDQDGEGITSGPNGEQSFDHHIERQAKGGDKDAPGEGNNDGSQGPVEYDDNEIDRMGQDFQNAVIQAAKAARSSKSAGTLPGGVERLLADLLEPQIDWRAYLEQTIKGTIKSGHTWLRPNRKAMQSGIYMPSMDVEDTIDIAICIDTSGSIGAHELRDFFSEVYGIMTQFTDFKIKMWCFDTKVGGYAEFDETNIDDLESYQPVGGGGTDFMANWQFMRKNDIVPNKLIMFTDGYPCGAWGEENYCDVLYIVHGGWVGRAPSEYPQAPFGVSVPYVARAD